MSKYFLTIIFFFVICLIAFTTSIYKFIKLYKSNGGYNLTKKWFDKEGGLKSFNIYLMACHPRVFTHLIKLFMKHTKELWSKSLYYDILAFLWSLPLVCFSICNWSDLPLCAMATFYLLINHKTKFTKSKIINIAILVGAFFLMHLYSKINFP